jgi:hypothetical protein
MPNEQRDFQSHGIAWHGMAWHRTPHPPEIPKTRRRSVTVTVSDANATQLTVVDHKVLPLPPPLDVSAILVLVHYVIHVAVGAIVMAYLVEGARQSARSRRLERRQCQFPLLLRG